MTVSKSSEGMLFLEGECPSEDAEILLQHLAQDPAATVDLRNCELAHTAVIQVLLAARPKLNGPPASDTALWRFAYPALISLP